MSAHPDTRAIRAILLDVEGTTTPMAFVTQVLFPYARRHLREHLERHAESADCAPVLAALRREHAGLLHEADAPPPWIDEPRAGRLASAASFAEWLMDRDRKATALKELQGRIWEEGYRRGELIGQVFDDVPAALRRWSDERLAVAIFSSGSVRAQRLLFRYSTAGDLTGLLTAHFDTQVGAKADAESYRRIARELGVAPEDVLFVSDAPRELDAATGAGMRVLVSVRPGNPPLTGAARYDAIETFDQIATGATDPKD